MCKAIEKAGMEGPYSGLLLGFPLTFLGSRDTVNILHHEFKAVKVKRF